MVYLGAVTQHAATNRNGVQSFSVIYLFYICFIFFNNLFLHNGNKLDMGCRDYTKV